MQILGLVRFQLKSLYIEYLFTSGQSKQLIYVLN